MKISLKDNLKTNKGITLIALVITIIVLLILAGVSIAMLTGDNGILTKSQNAKTKTKDAEVDERVKLVLAQLPLEKYQGTKTLEEYLKESFGDDNVTYDEVTKQYKVIVDGYEAIIDSEGKLVGEIQKAGPKPVVDNASIKITLEDGSDITEEQDEGTKLKIEFTASIEGGEITGVEEPTGAELGENGKITYITNGTEKEITFKIVGTVDGNIYRTTKKISVADKYKIDHSEVVVSTIAKTGVFNNGNIAEVREGDIPIPVGYTYVKGDKKGGAVITDAASGQEGEGSEFVWIPVSKINDMAQCDQVDGTCNIQADTNDGHLYCSTHNNTNIVGKLYATTTGNNFGTVNTSYNANNGLREPAVVTGNDSGTGSSYDASNYSKAGFSGKDAMLTGLQSEYKNMATSVEKYGGFYVGRYETSLNNATATDTGDSDSTSVQSKVGVISANNTLRKTNMWYGLYNMSKTYAPEKNSDGSDNTSQSVVSSMIWGSQYDAMMRWMQENGITVTDYTPTDLSIGTTSKNTTRVTGGANSGQSVSKDKLSNIYDLLGNSFEWTLEARNANARVGRGGDYRNGVYSPSNRYDGTATRSFDNDGSRLTLYIK